MALSVSHQKLTEFWQPGKVRVILNLSSPDGHSFNDNINDHLLEKVVMSTARQVGYTIIDCVWCWCQNLEIRSP